MLSYFRSSPSRIYTQDPETHIIKGAEPFEMGSGEHALLFVHGWTSSPREMRFLAEQLQEHYFCKGILLGGHGRNVQDLEEFGWQDHLKQVQEVFSQLALQYKTVSIIGLSYGGTLALHTAVRRKVHQIVLLAPFLQSTARGLKWFPDSSLIPYLPKVLKNIGKKSNPIFDPKASADHIAYHTMPLKPLQSLVECTQELLPQLPKIHCPTLILHSTQDETSDFNGSVEILKSISSTSKSLIALSRSNHVITLDYEKEWVEHSVKRWLQRKES